MRTRILIPTLLLCLPLGAGEPTDSERAIALLKKPDAQARKEGTRLMNQELRRLLAPFLEAMKDKDPEVRRRVSAALLALVPHHDRQPLPLPRPVQGQLWVAGRFKAPRLVVMPKFKIQQLALQHFFVANAATGKRYLKELKRVGATAELATVGKLTGLRIQKVQAKKAAAKAGLQVGDIIVSVNGVTVNSLEALARAFAGKQLRIEVLPKAFAGKQLQKKKKIRWAGVKLKVRRGDKTLDIKLP